MRKWNATLLFDGTSCLCSKCSYRETEACRDNTKRDRQRQERCCFRFRARWKETHDVPLKPTSAAGLNKHTCFSLSSWFYSHFFLKHSICPELSSLAHCFTLLPLWHGPCLVFSRSIFFLPFLPLRMEGYSLHVLFSLFFFHLWLFIYPHSCLLLKSLFLAPFFFFFYQFISFLFFDSLHLSILFHVIPLYNYSSPPSIAFACLLLYFRAPLLSAGPGVLPSVQDDMSGWRDGSSLKPLFAYTLY